MKGWFVNLVMRLFVGLCIRELYFTTKVTKKKQRHKGFSKRVKRLIVKSVAKEHSTAIFLPEMETRLGILI